MYELLGQIYKEILEIFDTDVVHMGGDEVRDSLFRDFPCNVKVVLRNIRPKYFKTYYIYFLG